MDTTREAHRLMAAALAAAAILAALPGAARGQDDDRLVRIREAYPPDAAARIEEVAADARRRGLPSAPVLDKALEGAAKGVAPGRVLPVLEEYVGRLTLARRSLGPEIPPEGVVAGADALRRGVSPDALGRLGRTAGPRTPVALVVMGDLVESGVPGDRALEMLQEALRRTRDQDPLLDVAATVRHLMRRGAPAQDAARRVLQAMRRGTPLHRLRGGRPGGGMDLTGLRPVPPGSEPVTERRRRTRGGG